MCSFVSSTFMHHFHLFSHENYIHISYSLCVLSQFFIFSFHFCHLQLFQKLTFSDASSTTSTPSHPPSQKYCHRHLYTQQVNSNRTPTRHRVAPSPEHHPTTAFHPNNADEHTKSNSTHIFEDFHHSNQSIRSGSGSQKNLTRLFRIRKASTTKMSQSSPTKRKENSTKNTNNMNNAKHLMETANDAMVKDKRCNHNANISTTATMSVDEEEIVFTENRIYMGNNSDDSGNGSMTTGSMANERQQFYTKGSETHENTVNRSCASSPKFIEKEILFNKMKMSRSERKSIPMSPLAKTTTQRPSLRSVYETNSMNSCDASPEHRYSEYDNLNEAFYRSHNCRTNDDTLSVTKNNESYIENWDFVRQNSDLDSGSATMSPSQPIGNRRLYEIHYEAAVSSRRTSISTAETWIDDESFDNVFNEEMERRCATYQ